MNPFALFHLSYRLYQPARSSLQWLQFQILNSGQRSSARGEKGQGLVEYALILIFIAMVVIVVLYYLGPAIRDTYTNIFCAVTLLEEFSPSTDYIIQDWSCVPQE